MLHGKGGEGTKSGVGERRGEAKKPALAGGRPILGFVSSSKVYNHIIECIAEQR